MKKKSIDDHKYMLNKPRIGTEVLEQARKSKSVVYGGKAMNAQLPLMLRRRTEDYDVYSKNPKKSAKKLEKKLDKGFGGDFFYVKEAEHKGTFKVMNRGVNLKDTKDDRNVADYSKKENRKTVTIKENKYVHLNEIKKDKMKSLRDKKFSFRHEKDRSDLERINTYNKHFKKKRGLF